MNCSKLYCKVGCCCLVFVCGSCSDWESELMSAIEIEITPTRGYISRKMCGTLLRVSATYCGARALIPRSETPYTSKGCFWVKGLAMH